MQIRSFGTDFSPGVGSTKNVDLCNLQRNSVVKEGKIVHNEQKWIMLGKISLVLQVADQTPTRHFTDILPGKHSFTTIRGKTICIFLLS